VKKIKSDGQSVARFLSDALTASLKVSANQEFRKRILNEFNKKGVLARLLKHDVQPDKLVDLLCSVPGFLLEPESDGIFFISDDDEKALKRHIAKILRAVSNLQELIERKSDKELPREDFPAWFDDVDLRMTMTEQIPLGEGLSHLDVSGVLREYDRKIKDWLDASRKSAEIGSTALSKVLEAKVHKMNRATIFLMRAVESQIGPNHDPLARDLRNTAAVMELIQTKLKVSQDTVKTIRKKIRKDPNGSIAVAQKSLDCFLEKLGVTSRIK
jgi:hypothetical protein